MNTIRNMFGIKDLRNKITLTLILLLVYKLGMYISVPGVERDILSDMMANSGALGVANLISGGALGQFSIFAMGIMPYITASIIIQLLSLDVVPKLTEWSKQGADGQHKTKRVTRYLTLVLAVLQSYGMSYGFSKMYPGLVINETIGGFLMISLFLTIGTIVLMVFGEIIEKKGIGNGISMIIFAGILMGMPTAVSMYYTMEFTDVGDQMFLKVIKTVGLLFLMMALIVAVVYVHKAERRVPIRTSVQGGNRKEGIAFQGATNFLPIKLNSAGVIPVIFSVSIITVPTTFAQMFPNAAWSAFATKYLGMQSVTGMILYAVFIILFTYFYAFIQMNPEKVAKNLQESGTYIPGIRPGKSTEEYIENVLKRVTFVGSLFLAIIAIIPLLFANALGLPQQIQIGGVSLIILVSVGLDVMSRIQAEMKQKSYKGFLK